MAKRNNPATISLNSTHIEAQILEFSNGDLPPGTSTQRASILLTTTKDLVQNVLGLSPEDQAKFVDKTDQVCKSTHLS